MNIPKIDESHRCNNPEWCATHATHKIHTKRKHFLANMYKQNFEKKYEYKDFQIILTITSHLS